MTVVVTGYEPFGDHEQNPSQHIAETLDGETIADHDVVGRVLPVEFDRASDEIATLVEEHDPAVVISTGLAPGAPAVRVERVGIDVNDCMGRPDNAGDDPSNERITGETDAYFASLPVTDIVEALLDDGIPARLSNTAGTHLCNNALYTTRHLVETNGLDVQSGFLHVPFTPEQAAAKGADLESVSGGGSIPASLPLELQVEATRTAVETTLEDA